MGFSEIRGQDRALHDLHFAWQQERIPNAYLFTGPQGCGKRTTALILARRMNCLGESSSWEPCERCAACQKILHETHPDVWVVEPEKQLMRISQIREIQRMTRFAPQEGRLRVVILDQIEKMNRESANAFLKLLEEPPPNNLFVLCTASPGQILPTILSRCQRVPFAPLRRPVLSSWLEERHGIDAAQAFLLAGLAEGSPGRALQLHEHLPDDQRRSLLTALPTLHRVPSGSTVALELAERLNKVGDQLPLYLDLLRSWLRDLLMLREIGPDPNALIHQDLQEHLVQHADILSTPALFRAVQAIDQCEVALRRNAASLLTLEHLFLVLGGMG
ncbi:MAG: DNA polymerase III subunit delta' [Myxococcales bacterium]|nr:DNA polymerase III subunit delta' [Myxococcales bacterium]MCB9644836.1 DNA polymerase III subunit delta' [Myxococcales bacterium]